MKLLFLDVDGVLNDGYRGYPHVVEHCLRHLKYIIEETKAQIVLSSNWRLFNEYRGVLMPKLIEHGIIEKDVFGSTPDLDLDHLPLRPREILQWIRDNTSICPWQKNKQLPQILQFVVLDDRNLVKELYGESLHGHFVQTNSHIGLTREIAKKVIQLLDCPPQLTCMSTWSLNHWSIFYEFDHVNYVPSSAGIQVVDTRECQEKVHTPLNHLPSSILYLMVSFLSIADLAAISPVSRDFNIIASSNKVWQPLHESLNEKESQTDSLSTKDSECQSWPLSSPIDGYYKVLCSLFLVSAKCSSLAKLDFVQKLLCSSCHDTEPCRRCSEKTTKSISSSKFGLPDESKKKEFVHRKQLQKTKKLRRLYCEAEAQLTVLLKWGSHNDSRKQRCKTPTKKSVDGGTTISKLFQPRKSK